MTPTPETALVWILEKAFSAVESSATLITFSCIWQLDTGVVREISLYCADRKTWALAFATKIKYRKKNVASVTFMEQESLAPVTCSNTHHAER